MMSKLAGRGEARLPRAFRAAGVAAGIKDGRTPDMALLVSDRPATMAGTFTTNRICAAPVKLNRQRIRRGIGRAIVVNSGVANACTGERGLRDARQMTVWVAERLGVGETDVYVCSTGRIGVYLPMDVVERGIGMLFESLSEEGGEQAARAIMTTDTRPKRWTVEFRVGGREVRLTGLAKGAGMIEPNMATMLCFLLTDAAVERAALQRALTAAVDRSFNRITVDGDRSTNDTVLMMANGASGAPELREERPGWSTFMAALEEVTGQLAHMIVADGEGATKVIRIRVRGGATARDAERAARAVANSLLVKTAWAGDDPNWGRVMDALGYSGAKVVESKIDIDYDGRPAVRRGVAGPASTDELRDVVRQGEFTVDIHLHMGRAEATVWTCNLTEEYVRINR